MAIYFLDEQAGFHFPDPMLSDPDGLLAVGGDLSTGRLLEAYRKGIFPWFNAEDPPLWWSPDPRYVIFPEEIYVSKTMRQLMRRNTFTVTFDRAFESVMRACGSTPRRNQGGTWVTDEFLDAYTHLHQLGYAHSVEVWQGEALAGGLYGVSLGKCFFGESMFTWVDNASKMALITLAKTLESRGFWLIDCQMPTEHLVSMGARDMTKKAFLDKLLQNELENNLLGSWADWI